MIIIFWDILPTEIYIETINHAIAIDKACNNLSVGHWQWKTEIIIVLYGYLQNQFQEHHLDIMLTENSRNS